MAAKTSRTNFPGASATSSRTRQRLPAAPTRALRPIQYLGNKLRSLDDVLSASLELAPVGRCVDLFTGTSVVAQGLASAGLNVTAVDALAFAANFASALLSVDRASDDEPVASPVEKLLATLPGVLERSPFASWMDREQSALEKSDGPQLIELSKRIPQVWRRAGARGALAAALSTVQAAGGSVPPCPAVITTHYAGTYFGVKQAALLDGIRHELGRMATHGELSRWQYSVLLAALCAAASDAAFSPGKHFAQPHRLGDGKSEQSLDFLAKRIVQDRSIDIAATFAARAREIEACASPPGAGHRAIATTFEKVAASPEALGPIDLVYADPPYTAQQYSRFYHVLEVLVENRVPTLQRVAGRFTSGLYPSNRHLSRFCSKRHAPRAFEELVNLADQLSADLLISYSASRSGSSGNDRMVTLEELVAICSERVGASRVEVRSLGHAYRQFNSQALAVSGREDAEYLISRRKRC